MALGKENVRAVGIQQQQQQQQQFIAPKAEYYSYLQVVKLLSPDVYCSNRIAVVFNAGLSKSFQVEGW